MQRTEILALVAGAIVGVWGGMLGAFLVCTGSWQVLYRFLEYSDDKKHILIQDERI
jgi:hypothetical protein